MCAVSIITPESWIGNPMKHLLIQVCCDYRCVNPTFMTP